jgi:serine protease Do
MGNQRTWFLAALAGVLVIGVMQLRSVAEPNSAAVTPRIAEQAVPAPASAAAPLPPRVVQVSGLPDFSALVAANGAAVVNVSVIERAERRAALPFGGGGDDDPFAQFFRRFQIPSPERAPPSRGTGSGFIVSSDGYVLTNAHVVSDAAQVSVRLTDRREFTAKVVGVDKRSDVALLKIDAKGLPAVSFGDPKRLKPGQWVVAIGSPFGFDNSVTAGVVSATARALPDENYVPFIQTDVAVNPGNSGGPLFNLDGQVVGINSQIYSRTGGYMGLSFAIPIDLALNVKKQLLQHGKVSRGRIGVGVQEVDQKLARSFSLDRPRGALISAVEAKGPGEKAGLKAGDVVLRVNGAAVERSADLPSLIASIAPGGVAHLVVWRAQRETAIDVRTVALDESAARVAREEATDDANSKLGLGLRPLTPQEQEQLGTRGKLLVEDASGPALDAGIQSGDVVLAVNGTRVLSIDELRREIKRGGHNVALLIQRREAELYVPVDIG